MEWVQLFVPLVVGMGSAAIGAFIGVKVGIVRLQEQLKAVTTLMNEMEKRIGLRVDLFQSGNQERLSAHEKRIARMETKVFNLPSLEG